MTSGIVKAAVGLMAGIFFNINNAISSEKYIPPVSHPMEISQTLEDKVDSSDIFLEENKIYIDFESEYNISNGFSFNPVNGVLKSDFGKNGQFSYNIGDDDFSFKLNDNSNSHYVLDFFKDIESLDDDKKEKDNFSVFDWSLEEVIGMLKKIDEFSNIKKENDSFRYTIDLPASAKGENNIFIERKFKFSSDSKVNIMNGFFNSYDFRSKFYFNAVANWDDDFFKRTSAGAEGMLSHELNIQNGFFLEANRVFSGDKFYGGGFLSETNEKTSRSEGCYAKGRLDDDFSLDIGKWRIKEKMKKSEEIFYLKGGDCWGNWSSFLNFGLRINSRNGLYNLKGKNTLLKLNSNEFHKNNFDYKSVKNINDSFVDFIYGASGKMDVFNFKNFDFDVYGCLENYPKNNSNVGITLQNPFLNVMADSDFYFAAWNPFRGKSFDFNEKVNRKSSFIKEHLEDINFWEGKRGQYIFAEKTYSGRKIGAAFCHDKFSLFGGINRNKEIGVFGGLNFKGFDFKGEYLKVGNHGKVDLGVNFNVSNNYYVFASGNILDDIYEGNVEVKIPF